MRLVSVNVGASQLFVRGGRHYSSSINKRPVNKPAVVSSAGVAGDHVSELKVHGGADKAICCYPHEHYAHWAQRLESKVEVPAFGENFTTEGLLEEQVCVGDTFRVGSALVQVSQPRQPCWKLANKHFEPRLIQWVNESAWTGFYLRVLEAGPVEAGDEVTLVSRPFADLTVAFMTRFRLSKTPDRAMLERLAGLPELSQSWRQHMARTLTGETQDQE